MTFKSVNLAKQARICRRNILFFLDSTVLIKLRRNTHNMSKKMILVSCSFPNERIHTWTHHQKGINLADHQIY